MVRIPMRLDPKRKYLQVALNSTLEDARQIIQQLPVSDRILVEAGTPFIKRYGEAGIRQIYNWYSAHLGGGGLATTLAPSLPGWLSMLSGTLPKQVRSREVSSSSAPHPYVVADLKTMDRGATEVGIAARGGASGAIALGSAPVETLNAFIDACAASGIDAMVDMMNVEFPLGVLRKLRRPPAVVVVHRGVDEEHDNREKMLPLYEIRRIKGNYDLLIAVAGGDTLREVQSAVFNDADIVVVWKAVYQQTAETAALVDGFLKAIR